jgi:enoyl-[acyl-carrier protein] reductase I
MPTNKPSWKPNKDLPVGKGATVQQFFATSGPYQLEIDVAPWGEGHLKVNGIEIAHIKDRKDRRQAFHDLKQIAEHHLKNQAKHSPDKMKNPK